MCVRIDIRDQFYTTYYAFVYIMVQVGIEADPESALDQTGVNRFWSHAGQIKASMA